jgi:hypothetical protein
MFLRCLRCLLLPKFHLFLPHLRYRLSPYLRRFRCSRNCLKTPTTHWSHSLPTFLMYQQPQKFR